MSLWSTLKEAAIDAATTWIRKQTTPTPPPTDSGGSLPGADPQPTPIPVPPGPPPQPLSRFLSLSILEHRGHPLKAWLIPDFHEPIEARFPAPWRAEFSVPASVREGATLQVWPEGLVEKVSYADRVRIAGSTVDQLGGLPPTDTELDAITLDWSRYVRPLSPLRAQGEWIYETDTAKPWFAVGASVFAGFERYCTEGPGSLEATVRQLRGLGFNQLRVFLGYQGGLGSFDPRPHLDLLPAFWRWCADQGFYVHQTVLADCPAWIPEPAEQRQLFQLVQGMAINAPWVRLEGVNEGDDARNRAEGLLRLATLPTGLHAHGSCTQDGGVLSPTWGSIDYHPRRDGTDWPRRVGHNAWEDASAQYGLPVWASEIKRPDECGYADWQYFEAGANAALFCAGATFHSTEGKAAQPLHPETEACAEAFVQGCRAVPLYLQRGTYTAGHLDGCPVEWDDRWGGRAHAKIVGNQACVVLAGMERGASGYIRPRGPWGIVDVRGPYGQVLMLSR